LLVSVRSLPASFCRCKKLCVRDEYLAGALGLMALDLVFRSGQAWPILPFWQVRTSKLNLSTLIDNSQVFFVRMTIPGAGLTGFAPNTMAVQP
jgi:hypothetical protein